MRTAEADILMIPGWSSSGQDHWQTRWERSLKTARRVEQTDWYHPSRDAWVGEIVTAIASCQRPVILIAHSLGVIAAVHALAAGPPGAVSGALLVAPADVEHAHHWPITQGQSLDAAGCGFVPLPLGALPCPSRVLASRNDPYCSYERAAILAARWGATLADAGEAGHINVASGHGPWPDGLLQLGGFLRTLSPAPSALN
jgi:uncharacterized protein